jgi:hypothetical protein
MNDLRGAFRVLQVVSTTKTDTFSSTATSPTDITGASVTITPSATSSKILVMYSFSMASNAGTESAVQLLRDSTVIGGGTPAGSRLSAASISTIPTNAIYQHVTNFLDSPNTTSAITYKLRAWTINGTFYVGRTAPDTDNAAAGSARSGLTITAMEISA